MSSVLIKLVLEESKVVSILSKIFLIAGLLCHLYHIIDQSNQRWLTKSCSIVLALNFKSNLILSFCFSSISLSWHISASFLVKRLKLYHLYSLKPCHSFHFHEALGFEFVRINTAHSQRKRKSLLITEENHDFKLLNPSRHDPDLLKL